MGVVSKKVSEGKLLTAEQARDVVARAMPEEDFRDRRVLLIVPDGTRTAPVGTMFKSIHDQIGGTVASLDVMIALGTHQAMSEEAIEQRLEIAHEERTGLYASVQFFNHAWDDPGALRNIGTLSTEEISDLSGGLFEMDVPVEVNAKLFDYDQMLAAHRCSIFSTGSVPSSPRQKSSVTNGHRSERSSIALARWSKSPSLPSAWSSRAAV